MTAVERVLEYCALDQEPPAQAPTDRRPPSNWPSNGLITYHNVSMSYNNGSETSLALSHISLTIQPGEKIGIVGRTGAGKSSLIQTLFRMCKLFHGRIEIDHIDISTVGLDDLRRRISIIPQDPVLFTGTMRNNLDQFGDYSDVEIWQALEQVSGVMCIFYESTLVLIVNERIRVTFVLIVILIIESGSTETSCERCNGSRAAISSQRGWYQSQCWTKTVSLFSKSDSQEVQNTCDR